MYSEKKLFQLVAEMAEAESARARKDYLAALIKVNLFIIDELGMKKMPQNTADDLLEVVHRFLFFEFPF